MPKVRTPGTEVRDALAAATSRARDRAIVETLFGSGLRHGELSALTVTDVDVAAGTLVIRKSKTGRPRVAVMDPRAQQAMRAWIAERDRRQPDHESLWLRARGAGPLRPDGLKIVIRRIADRAGVEFSSHDARRSFAVAWLRAGGSEVGLQQVCGWSDVSMVARYTRERAAELALQEAARLWAS